ncbi:related to ALG11-required for asparagine-linked glycosylation [Sporisorium reilianum SRZ2]|uniref:GDP-Man:Man(3)GlcNAc(2)-PP-Dol alpha-1,2-mannosyltransferase n=1 Tax=Sporisorium reilianum (strain SRZ2) TaxID=999809 RepID=E6ZYV1_SPORE|nr:related to ALG11-required for asparagine-linked glycosylation [Sporisorium reilianum SRZ2]
MERLLNLQTALSLGYVGSMVLTAYLSSLFLLPATSTRKTRLIFLWLAFDCICHLTLEGPWLYLSTQARSVNASTSFFGFLWQEYAAADARWGTGDATLAAMEFVTVLLAGPLAGWCAWLLARGDGAYHYWVVVLSTAELYGGWMTFAPEWLVGSGALETRDWLLLWVYLVFMNLVWVVVPAWLMVDSYRVVVRCVRGAKGVDGTVAPVAAKKEVGTVASGASTRTLSGSAYLLLVAAVFIYIMPTASASTPTYDPSGSTTLFPTTAHREPMLTTLRNLLVPLLLPLGLLVFSFTVGALQVLNKALRRVRKTNRSRRRKLLAALSIDEKTTPVTVLGFFHPYCNAGGGGERVLYTALAWHLSQSSSTVAVVYTGDYPGASKAEILAKAEARFGIRVDAARVAMVGLARRWMVEDATWKRLTLVGQSYGSVWLGAEALSQLVPDVWIDTMGYAFTYPLARLFNRALPIAAYVHYPVVSTDMLARVSARQAGHTNDARTANSALRTRAKLVYYRVVARAYSWALRRADAVVGNGSWTRAHLAQLMRRSDVGVVFPPCDTAEMEAFGLQRESRTVVSLAQFRPEKEHPTQLHVLRRLLDTRPDLFSGENGVKLVMMGSSRNADDEARIELLRALATSLRLDAHVELVVNANYATICTHLAHASVGISTMKDEHFGINVVEFMAAGLVTLSHKSAGPWLDIAVPSANHPLGAAEEGKGEMAVGYHAESVDEFAAVLAHIFDVQDKEPGEVVQMRRAARARAQSVFGAQAFTAAWQTQLWAPLEAKLQRSRPTEAKEKKEQ